MKKRYVRDSVERAEDDILERQVPVTDSRSHFSFPVNYGHLSKSKNHLKADRVSLF